MRIPLWIVAGSVLAFTNAFAYGDMAGKQGATGDNLAVTIELPRSSPHLKVLSPAEIKSASAKGIVRLRVPVTSERLSGLPLAEVDKDPISVRDFRRALLPAAQEEGDEPSPHVKAKPTELLDRLVNIRLIVREAREIGLDELPEVRNLVDVYSRRTLREHLILSRTKGVEADEAEVEKLYREAVREWRIKGLLFKEEKDAAAFRDAVQGGISFEEAAKKFVTEGKAEAKGGEEGEFVRTREVSPGMAEQIGELKLGSVSPVIPTKDRFSVIKVEEERFPESMAARAMAQQRARNFAQNTALVEYNRQLTAKYVTFDKELFETLDFGGTVDNFQRMREDDRVIARIEGETPVTVSQLAQGIREQFYHGMGKAIEDGTVNERKVPVLNDLLSKRIFLKEALAQGLDKTPEFVGTVADYENSVLFGAFVEKVLRPEIKFSTSDLREYYEKHIDEYTFPEMIKLRSLSFGDASLAQAALDKLRKGTDFRWMKANAEGQLLSNTEEGASFGEGLVTVRSLPEAVRRALEGAEEGFFVLYREDEKRIHVMNIEKRVPSRVQKFEEVQKGVLQQVYKERVDKALADWTARLKKAYVTKVYAVGFSGSAP